MLIIKQGRSTMDGVLHIQSTGDGLVAHVEGGPIRILVDGDDIAMAIDDRTAGRDAVRTLSSRLARRRDNGRGLRALKSRLTTK